jgi:hypothetical protein
MKGEQKMCNKVDNSCREEKMGCKGCAYCKPIAKTDRTYCIKADCATKEECSRHIEHYQFDDKKQYSFIAECEEYQG